MLSARHLCPAESRCAICATRPEGRRFWPVCCGRIDIESLSRDRDQLWAEAKARFESGQVWWLDSSDLVQLAADQQEERYEGYPWEEVIGRG
jgi:predicted P-loop ATPase